MRYICIDLKSYYASKECVDRGLNPLTANLLVADESRSDQTICLAVSPSLKALGVPSRPRLFEAKQKIREAEVRLHTKIDYIIATPRMQTYIDTSAQIYKILLRYAAAEDIHVYSIDESFIDATPYLHLYHNIDDTESAHAMAIAMIKDVLKETGITATVGIGTNMFLCKVAMDIVAKKAPADKDGVRIASLDENSYRRLIWPHHPISDIWQIGPGTERTLAQYGMNTMGDVARMSTINEKFLYQKFGVNAEILVDHAWGIEPVKMENIKNYQPSANSLSTGQVLPRPYKYNEARIVFNEMAELLALDLFDKELVTDSLTYYVGYDYKSVIECIYTGPVHYDHYGRPTPDHTNATVKLRNKTNSTEEISSTLLASFDQKVNRTLLFRRLGISANKIAYDDGWFQLDLFTDYHKREQERRIKHAMLQIKRKYGSNAILKASNLLDGSTVRERNEQIGGHKA